MKQQQNSHTPRSEHVFVVRVWHEHDPVTSTAHLRGSVQDGPAAERKYFADWQELVGFMAGQVERR
jgi:hypothetical protein